MDPKRKNTAAKKNAVKAANKRNSLFIEDFVLKEPARKILNRRRSVFPPSSDEEDSNTTSISRITPPLFNDDDDLLTIHSEVRTSSQFADHHNKDSTTDRYRSNRELSLSDEELFSQTDPELEDRFGNKTPLQISSSANVNNRDASGSRGNGKENWKQYTPNPSQNRRKQHDGFNQLRAPAGSSGSDKDNRMRSSPYSAGTRNRERLDEVELFSQSNQEQEDQFEDETSPKISSSENSSQNRHHREILDDRNASGSRGNGKESRNRSTLNPVQNRRQQHDGFSHSRAPAGSSGNDKENRMRSSQYSSGTRNRQRMDDVVAPAGSSKRERESLIIPTSTSSQNRHQLGAQRDDTDTLAGSSSGKAKWNRIRLTPYQSQTRRQQQKRLDDFETPAFSSGKEKEKGTLSTLNSSQNRHQPRVRMDDADNPAGSGDKGKGNRIRSTLHSQNRNYERLDDVETPVGSSSKEKENRILSPSNSFQNRHQLRGRIDVINAPAGSSGNQFESDHPFRPVPVQPRQGRSQYALNDHEDETRRKRLQQAADLSFSDDDGRGNGKPECESCAWKHRYETLTVKYEKLKNEKSSTEVERNRLSNSLTSRIMDKALGFTSTDGFPPVQLIKSISDSTNIHKTFVRLLMREIWSSGFGNCTVTGRKTSNAKGRPSAKGSQRHFVAREVDGALDPEKVNFVVGRFYERLILRGTDPTTAGLIAKKDCARFMTQIISSFNQKGSW